MAKTLIALVVVLVIALGLQVVGVVSAPLTKSINIASYDGHNFGIWGYCNLKGEDCTSIALGYPSNDVLPNSNMAMLSKLLIVHVVAAGCTLIMLILVLVGFCGNRKYILTLSLLAVPSFLVSLLAFLAEILLFTRNLDYPGWFLLGAVILNGFAIVLLCLQHRRLGDKWQRSSETGSTNGGDDEKLINNPPVLPKDSFTQVNQADIFAPRRHGDYQYEDRRTEATGTTGTAAPSASSSAVRGGMAGSVANSTSRPYEPTTNSNNSGASMNNGQMPTSQASQMPRGRYNRQNQGAPPSQPPSLPPHQQPRGQQLPQPPSGYPPRSGVNTPVGAGQQAYSRGQTPQSYGYAEPQPPALPRKDTDPTLAVIHTAEDEFDFEAPPAGTDIAGVESARTSFGPGVVPVPRMRKTAGSAAAEPLDDGEARAGITPTGTPHIVRGITRDESRVGMVQYAPPETQGQGLGKYSQNRHYGPRGYNQNQNQDGVHTPDAGQGYGSPAPKQYNQHPQYDQYNPANSDGPRHQYQGQAPPHALQGGHVPPPGQNQLMERYMQELNTSQEYFEYNSEQDQIPQTPNSPGDSDFTSVSQRAEQRAAAVQHGDHAMPRENVANFPAQRRAAERNDLVLNANPDFALPGVRGGRMGGRRGRGRGR